MDSTKQKSKEEITKLKETLSRKIKQFELIKELRSIVSSSNEIEDGLSLFFEILANSFNVKAVSLRLLEQSGNLSRITVSYGLSKEYISKGEIDLSKSELNREVLLGKVVEVSNISNSSYIQYSKELISENVRSILGIPVFAKNSEVIGVLKLYFESDQPNIEDDEKDLFLDICTEIGLIIQNELSIRRLKEIDREKSLFLTTITHQLRSPVSGLQSLLKIIYDGYVGEVNPKQKELIERGMRRIDYMLNLISDLLALASSELQIKKEYTKIPIVDIVSQTFDSLKEMAFEKKIEFKLSRPKRELYIYGNEEDIKKVVENVVENAIKYTKEDGKVDVIVEEKQKKFATITVSDNGIGIPRESLPNLFQDFYRSSNAKEFSEQGTGLGLSIVKRIVEEHKGRIFLASEVGKGTTIKLFFSLLLEN